MIYYQHKKYVEITLTIKDDLNQEIKFFESQNFLVLVFGKNIYVNIHVYIFPKKTPRCPAVVTNNQRIYSAFRAHVDNKGGEFIYACAEKNRNHRIILPGRQPQVCRGFAKKCCTQCLENPLPSRFARTPGLRQNQESKGGF